MCLCSSARNKILAIYYLKKIELYDMWHVLSLIMSAQVPYTLQGLLIPESS